MPQAYHLTRRVRYHSSYPPLQMCIRDRAGAVLCGLVMLAGVLGFILALTGTVVGHEMVGGLR